MGLSAFGKSVPKKFGVSDRKYKVPGVIFHHTPWFDDLHHLGVCFFLHIAKVPWLHSKVYPYGYREVLPRVVIVYVSQERFLEIKGFSNQLQYLHVSTKKNQSITLSVTHLLWFQIHLPLLIRNPLMSMIHHLFWLITHHHGHLNYKANCWM